MAKVIVHDPGWNLSLVCSHPAAPSSGDPVRCGEMTGIALTDESGGQNPTGSTTVNLGPFVADLSVQAVDDVGNSAVALYDKLYYTDADTPVLSKKKSGYFYGYALETITSGSTATINVLHPQTTIPATGAGNMQYKGIETLVSDVMTIEEGGYYKVAGEGAAADDLATITGGNTGDLVVLEASVTGTTITVKDGTGNINLGGVDCTLDADGDKIMLIKSVDGDWDEVSRSGNE